MVKTIYFVRHSQGFHNVNDDYSIPDPFLTPLGEKQSLDLNSFTKDTFQKTADLLICSPLKRTIQTTLLAFPSLISRLGGREKVLVLPILQEAYGFACDIGSDKDLLESIPLFTSFDFSLLDPNWNSKTGIYSPDRVEERSKLVRLWLRKRKEERIVVVCHGDLLRVICDGVITTRPWKNAGVQIYKFLSENDEEAKLIRVEESERGWECEGEGSGV